MSIRMNGYEQNLRNKLQRDSSKREAEAAILEIREALYGDSYTQIHPVYIGHNNDTVSKNWPSVNALIGAYYSGNYNTDELEDFREIETVNEELESSLPNASAIAESLGYHEPVTIETMPEKKEWLARTADNKDIYISSETMAHMEAHPDVNIAHIHEAIGNVSMGDTPFLMKSIDMGRTVGKDNCVEVSADDKVESLYRKGRNGMTPIAMDKEPADTSLLTVGMALDDDGKLTMFTAFYGQLVPKEPWDNRLSPEEKAEAEQFWNTHALVVPDEAIDWERSNMKLSKEQIKEKILGKEDNSDKLSKSQILNQIGSSKTQINQGTHQIQRKM